MSEQIRHNGVVTAIGEDHLIVTILHQSACSACHARGGCLASDMQEKEIEVPRPEGHFAPGQKVTLLLQESMGVKALFYGYLLPFIILILTLVVVLQVAGNELLAGLSALGMLIPYYLLLYLFRNRMKKSFSFTIDANH